MHMKKIRNSLIRMTAILAACCLLAGGAAADENWLDAFELPEYQPVELENPSPAPIPLDAETPYYPHDDAFLPDNKGYVDATISVRVESMVIKKTPVQFTWVQIADPTQLRTALASPYPGRTEVRGTKMAEENHSVLAINGDWFILRPKKEGIIYRNGQLIREKSYGIYDSLIIDTEGDFHILRQPSDEEFKAWEGKITHSFVFGPALVINGEKVDLSDRKALSQYDNKLLGKVGGYKGTQRCVFCQMDKLSYLIITTEGPEQVKRGGFTVPEMADIAYEIGAQQAFNLDGGASAWLILGKERINTRKTKNLRKISDIIYFVTAEAGVPSQTEEPAE